MPESINDAEDFGAPTAAISDDGRYVVYSNWAHRLRGEGEDAYPDDFDDLFVYDRSMATTTPITVDGAGKPFDESSWSLSLSGDGRLYRVHL